MDLVEGQNTALMIPEYDRENGFMILGDIIDRYLTDSECYVAEALGKLFYDRSLSIYDHRVDGPERIAFNRGMDNFGDSSKYDGSKYGIDYYKYLGYRLLIQVKSMTKQMEVGRKKEECFAWQDMLRILYGPEQISRILKNPRAYIFS